MLRVVQGTAGLGVLAPALFAREQAQFFSAEQNETLVVLGDLIIPGSREASCNRLIDAMMLIESEKSRTELLSALAAFDAEAQSRYQKLFRQLEPGQQDTILTAASNGSGPLHSDFGVVKEWMADAYWSSQEGLRELGWTGRLAWDNFPDCGNPRPHN